MFIQNLILICLFVLKILSKNKFLHRNFVANLGKMTLYNPNVDLVNYNVYTKCGLIPSNCSQDIEGKQKSRVVRKPVFGVSDQVRHKPGCTTTEEG